MREPWTWLMRNRVLERLEHAGPFPTTLDVGCGPGLVMELFSPFLDVMGLDIDPEMVRQVREKGMEAVQGDAQDLPFEDDSFDIAYCSFTMLWVNDPGKAIAEMARVARRCVVCLAEPDYGGRICSPPEVALLDEALVRSLRAEGADPFVGRKLILFMERTGLEVESGVHPGTWSPSQLRDDARAEWDSLSRAVSGSVDAETMAKARSAWDRSLADGSLFMFNPVFYAIGWKR